MESTPRRISEDCLSDLQLDQLLAGELDGRPEGEKAEAHLQSCPPCSTAMDTVRADSQRFQEEFFVAGLAARTRRDLRSRRRRRWIPVAAALAASLTLFLLVGPRFLQTPGASDSIGQDSIGQESASEVRIKGAESLSLVVRRADGITEEVLRGALLRPDEAIRFRVHTTQLSYVTVVGLDASPAVSVYASSGSQGLLLDAERLASASSQGLYLDGSIVLDDTPGTERVVAVFCDQDVDVSVVQRAAEEALQAAQGDPARIQADLPIDCRQAAFVFRKDVAP